MAMARRRNPPGGADGQTESVERREALPDCERGAKPKGADGANWQTAPSLRRLIYRWRDKFFEGGKAALAFDGRKGSQSEKAALERPIEELQKLIGEQAIEIRFLKRLSRS